LLRWPTAPRLTATKTIPTIALWWKSICTR